MWGRRAEETGLRDDHELLLEGDVFTPDIIETWVAYKKEHEIDPVQLRRRPWELYLYLYCDI